jgi:hypothetical protein
MKKGERKRGFNQFRKQVRDKSGTARQVANCQSCQFLNRNDECSNPNVTEFDMVKEAHKTYCTFWRGFEYENGRKKDDVW